MKPAPRRAHAATITCACLLLVACARRGDAVATLSAARGRVERSTDGSSWKPAVVGVEFHLGDVLQTGANSQARLRLTNGSFISVGESGRLRFLGRAVAVKAQVAAGVDLAIELGSAEIERAVDDMTLETVLGRARIEKGARVRVHADGETASLEVLIGRTTLLGSEGEIPIEVGEGIRIKIGTAEIEQFRVTVGAAIVEEAAATPSDATPSAAPPPAAGEPERSTEATEREHGQADITIAAGESAILHDAKPPVLVRMRFDGLCAGEAVVDVRGAARLRRTTGVGSLVLRLRPGAQRYRIGCAGDPRGQAPRASGLLTLLRDSGNVQLSRRAPVNTIDTDGRNYTVLFQTRLPVLSLVWPTAPADASAFSLHVASRAGVTVIPASVPRHQLSSGALPEGTYTCWYATEDGKLSPKTRVTVRFDNAAPTAQFFPAASRALEATAGTIPVDGVTVEGAKVSVNDKPLLVDERGRFRTALPPLNGDEALAVRIEHPRTGVHYYIRRAGARP